MAALRVLLVCALSPQLSVKSLCPLSLCLSPLIVASALSSRCNDLDQMLLCGIRTHTHLPPARSIRLTLALWLTGISLVQYVCQWGSRLSCAPAYPWCLFFFFSQTPRFEAGSENTASFSGLSNDLKSHTLRCHCNGSVILVPRTKRPPFC